MNLRCLLRMIAFSLSALATTAAFADQRAVAVVSDLHFGVGKTAEGSWDAYEDFRWEEDWKAFLTAIDKKGAGKTDLILNGDTFEMWQSRGAPCGNQPSSTLGCNEAISLARFSHILTQHTASIEALVNFALTGENHVYLVPGNHDAALYFKKVADAWNAAVKRAGARITLVTSGYWQSHDKLIVADHGQQIGEDVNLFSKWPAPFDAGKGEMSLLKSWGEQFVQSFYNSYEDKFPIIDNMTSEAAGIRYALKQEGVSGSFMGAARFLKFILLDESWAQMNQLLGDKTGRAPKWDYEAIRQKGASFLHESFAKDDPLRALQPGVLEAPLTDDDINAMCALRLAKAAQHAKITTCPAQSLGSGGDTLGSLAASVFGSRDKDIKKHLKTALKAPEAKLYVYSHTHKADSFEIDDHKIHVLNTGAFQRLATPQWLESKAQKMKLSPSAAFAKLSPHDLPLCYVFVWVGPYDKAPAGELRRWTKDKTGYVDSAGRCR